MRNLIKAQTVNDGNRSLFESIMLPEVIRALRDWEKETTNSVLIGGVALSYYIKPRATQDIDVLYASDTDIPEFVQGFKKNRPHAFMHLKTQVEVEVVTPTHINVPASIINKIMETSILSNGIKVASASGLVALKLFRLNIQDKADIVALILAAPIDISGFGLTQNQIDKYYALTIEAQNEKSQPK
jgi:hypothetical protein